MKKRLFCALMALVVAVCIMPVHAVADFEPDPMPGSPGKPVSFLTDFPALAEKYHVSEELVREKFPDGIPNLLPDFQVEAVFKGIGIKFETVDTDYVFNAEHFYARNTDDTVVSFQSDMNALSGKYFVSKTVLRRHFPQGIPDFLSEEQVRSILRGAPMIFKVGMKWYRYNVSDSSVNVPVATASESVLYEDLRKDYIWYTSFGKLTYKYGGKIVGQKSVETIYQVGHQNSGNADAKGRAWCAMQLYNYGKPVLVQNTSEKIYDAGKEGKCVKASCNSGQAPSGTLLKRPDYVHFSYRNLNTDWNVSFKVIASI